MSRADELIKLKEELNERHPLHPHDYCPFCKVILELPAIAHEFRELEYRYESLFESAGRKSTEAEQLQQQIRDTMKWFDVCRSWACCEKHQEKYINDQT